MDESLRAQLEKREALLDKIRGVLISALNLRLQNDEIDPDASLFGTGLSLDSVDALELVVALETAFKVRLPELGQRTALRSVNSLGDLIEQLTPATGASA